MIVRVNQDYLLMDIRTFEITTISVEYVYHASDGTKILKAFKSIGYDITIPPYLDRINNHPLYKQVDMYKYIVQYDHRNAAKAIRAIFKDKVQSVDDNPHLTEGGKIYARETRLKQYRILLENLKEIYEAEHRSEIHICGLGTQICGHD